MSADKVSTNTAFLCAKVVFITHAGKDIGGGHLSRCFALSQALELNGAVCSWVLNEECAARADVLGITGKNFLPDPFGHEALKCLNRVDFAVVDTYTADEAFFHGISEITRLVVIDDLHDKGVERFSDVVINYGAGASAVFYASPSCRYLLGPRYALLRRAYWELEPSCGDYVLFVPGAADVLNAAERAIELWALDFPELIVVLGPHVPIERCSDAKMAAEGRANISVLRDPEDFPNLLANAGFVICSASVTAYEALAMRKKTAVFSVAPNQEGLGEILRGLGAAYNIGDWRSVSRDIIRDAFTFSPDDDILERLVNRRGALECAKELMDPVSREAD
jgi:spore coat polysaccharide biosynthesis predicted glycosyltransferase SpsG